MQVDDIGTDLDWRSAIAFGRFEEIKETKERTEILAKLLKRFPMLTPVEAAIAQDGCPMEVVVFRIKIDRITGVSEGSVSANSACLDVRS